MSDRGMKKWAPYASLIEQKGTMARMLREKKKISRPHISADQAELIERTLTNYRGGRLRVTYFADGFIRVCDVAIKRIDVLNRQIECDEITIAYRDILDVEE